MAIEDETENRAVSAAEEEILMPGDPKGAQKTLKELLIGIVLYGFLLWLVPVWFFADKAAYSVSVWIGIATAVCMALHMYRTLDRALSNEAGAQKAVVTGSMIRYMAAIAVLVILQYIGKGSRPVAAFFGIMGLKAGAYMQPFVHKAVVFIQNRKTIEKETEVVRR